jgi:hypothetical protein
MKNGNEIVRGLFVAFTLTVLLEILLWSFTFLAPHEELFQRQDRRDISRLEATFKTELNPLYCDNIHKTQSGHKKLSKCLLKKLPSLANKNIWVFGGSTTQGFECSNSTTWVNFLPLGENGRIRNFAKGGKTSHYSIGKLKKALSTDRPDLIIWAHLFNEFNLVEKDDDIYEGFIPRADQTLYRRVMIYRVMKNLIYGNLNLDNIHAYFKAFPKEKRDDYFPYIFSAYKRDPSKQKKNLDEIDTAIDHQYKLLTKFLKDEGIPSTYIKIPYDKNYFLTQSKDLHAFFNQVVEQSYRTIEKNFKWRGFEVISVDACFEEGL